MTSFFNSSKFHWNDVEPIEQDDGPNPVVTIAYTTEYKSLMNYFRALLNKAEYSDRGLALTEELLDHNAANYTVWQYRRACLRELKSDLYEELDFMDNFAEDNPKNYQIWHHRRAVVEELNDGSRELEFCENVFEVDAKNYHAWAHRQWAVKKFVLWAHELPFIEECLDKDIRNNSAWNHRWFVVHQDSTEPVTQDILERELEFTYKALDKVHKNESAWNYLRGLARFHPEIKEEILNKCRDLVETRDSKNYLAIALLADLSEREGNPESIQYAIKLFEQLIQLDPIRAKCWMRRFQAAQQTLTKF